MVSILLVTAGSGSGYGSGTGAGDGIGLNVGWTAGSVFTGSLTGLVIETTVTVTGFGSFGLLNVCERTVTVGLPGSEVVEVNVEEDEVPDEVVEVKLEAVTVVDLIVTTGLEGVGVGGSGAADLMGTGTSW